MVGRNSFSGTASGVRDSAYFFETGPDGRLGPEHPSPVLVVPPPKPKSSLWDVWRGRLFLIIFVLFSLEIGIILTVVPWTPFWNNNSLLIEFPRLQEILMNDFVRGVVSGLGLVDLWLAIAEAVRYRESPN